MLVAAAKAGFDIDDLEKTHPRRFEHPFDSSRKRMTVVCEVDGRSGGVREGRPQGDHRAVHARARRGTACAPSRTTDRAAALAANDRLASQALRVIAVRERPVAAGRGRRRHVAAMERDLTLLGLEAMQDPPRPEVTDGGGRVPHGRHPRRHDHRRLRPHRRGDRSQDRHHRRRRRSRHHRPDLGRHGRRRAQGGLRSARSCSPASCPSTRCVSRRRCSPWGTSSR